MTAAKRYEWTQQRIAELDRLVLVSTPRKIIAEKFGISTRQVEKTVTRFNLSCAANFVKQLAKVILDQHADSEFSVADIRIDKFSAEMTVMRRSMISLEARRCITTTGQMKKSHSGIEYPIFVADNEKISALLRRPARKMARKEATLQEGTYRPVPHLTCHRMAL